MAARSASSSPERGSNKSPTRYSPTRLTKQELANSLQQQMEEATRRRRDQPQYVAGKVGVASYEPSPPKAPVAMWQSAPSMDMSAYASPPPPQREVSYARRNNNNPAAAVDPEAKLRQVYAAESYSHELQRQIEERKLREKLIRERERQISRELAQDGAISEKRRTGRAWVKPDAGAENYDDPIPNRATPAPYVPMAPPALTPAVDMVSPIKSESEPSFSQRRQSDKPKYGRRASPERSGDAAPISVRHVSPERMRESEFVLRSDRKLFDFELREGYERDRRAAQQQQQEELQAALERQIAERRAAKERAKQEELRLDALMELRVKRELEELAQQERQRDEELARAHEENQNINMQQIQQRKAPPPPPPGPSGTSQRGGGGGVNSRKTSVAQPSVLGGRPVDGGLNDSQNGRPASLSPAPAAGAANGVTREDFDSLVQALVDIKEQIIRQQSRPLVEVVPPMMIESVKEPLPPPPPAAPQPIESGFNFVKRDTSDEEAKRILLRNQQRLAALRYADHHDDILKAFLLQDSTAAVRTMTQFLSKQTPYQQPSAYTAANGPGSPYAVPRPSMQRAHTSMY